MESKKEILVFSRMHIKNYGDPIIGDCCKYLIEKTAQENGIDVHVSMADVYEEDEAVIKQQLHGKDAVVFPGGGMNSIAFNRIVLNILGLIEEQGNIKVFFNAAGIKRVHIKEKNEKLLLRIFKKKQVVQITTRGDYAQMLEYIKKPKKYPARLVLDPAVWADEAYQIQKNPKAKKIGVGIIRPEIYEINGNDVSVEDVFEMYTRIIRELENKGYKWELFTNGMKKDYSFGIELLKRLRRPKWRYLRRNVKNSRDLVRRIAGYRGVIASRLHANILAVSLRVPAVGLVWNDKMNLFADVIGEQDRFINQEHLQDGAYIVRRLEQAMEKGYQEDRIGEMKAVTIETIKNIIQTPG